VGSGGAPSRGGLFVCYACGMTQQVPMQHSHQGPSHREMMPTRRSGYPQEAPRPTRHAPPARVISAGGNSELLIGAGGELDSPDSKGHASALTTSVKAATKATKSAASSAASAMSRAGGPSSSSAGHLAGGGANEAPLLGSAPDADAVADFGKYEPPKASWAWAGGSSSGSGSKAKRLGDGAPSASDYANMDEEGGSLMGEGPPRAGSGSGGGGSGSSWLPWKNRKAGDEMKESLWDRVHLGDEWELIRLRASDLT